MVGDDAHASLVEAIAWWRIGDADGRRVLTDAATEALVAGAESEALAELAGLPGDESPFAVDALLARVIAELGLDRALSADQEMLSVRRLARAVLTGEIGERDLTRWVHTRFHHESSSDLVNRLAELDDDLDIAQDGIKGSVADAHARIREVASMLVNGPQAD
ncbi:hypothetical protein ACUOFU_12305 [Microbacterium arabinogalactanolyticum]|jgi:hypothetical protein|uniref:hypothetical protein n=1 Tax=Microbacterium arabinogalactanolyticum TaxID=69365 RepID=UPI0040446117